MTIEDAIRVISHPVFTNRRIEIATQMAVKAMRATQWRTGYPEEDGRYIVMTKGAKKPEVLSFAKHRDGEQNVWYGQFLKHTVTHWMPLPEPPQEP